MRQELTDRVNAIEECYEFMLAYAAQGLPGDSGSQSGSQLREYLRRAALALTGLAAAYESEIPDPPAAYLSFLTVLNRDANDALAAVELVRAQPALSSQLIDNLNASIHVRALLTDIFLIDEVLKGHASPAAARTD
jgi:hypothetical protein